MDLAATKLSEWLGPPPPARPRRIVSLCPSITETLFALGAGERLVGVTRFCIHPSPAIASVPKVGGTKDPDLAAIRALAPDLVFVNREENRRSDALAIAEFAPVHVSHPRSPRDVPALVRELGERLGTEGMGGEIASQIEQGIAALTAAALRTRFRFAYLIWREPWMVAGRGTYIDALVELAGGSNVLGPEEGEYPVIGLDRLLAERPDVVFLPDEPYRFRERHVSELREAGVAARVELVSGDDWCWHGSRTVRGLEAAVQLTASICIDRPN